MIAPIKKTYFFYFLESLRGNRFTKIQLFSADMVGIFLKNSEYPSELVD